jgi:hypothetical protein
MSDDNQNSKIDMLSDERRAEIHTLIARKWAGIKIRKFMIKKYPDEPDLDLHGNTYQRYVKRQRPAIEKAAELQANLIRTNQEFEDLNAGITTVPDKAHALEAILQECRARRRSITALNAPQGGMDPKWETHLAGYLKLEKDVWESMEKVKQTQQIVQGQVSQTELDACITMLMLSVADAYKSLYGSTDFLKFENVMATRFQDRIDRWLPNRKGLNLAGVIAPNPVEGTN